MKKYLESTKLRSGTIKKYLEILERLFHFRAPGIGLSPTVFMGLCLARVSRRFFFGTFFYCGLPFYGLVLYALK
jgi:hypothetical protein